MACMCCLAGIDRELVPMFGTVLGAAGLPRLASIAGLNVGEVGRLSPEVLVCDIDAVVGDKLEWLRQIRFVLPESLIAVYTGDMQMSWGRACHIAGANCLLSKDADAAALSHGVRDALASGCYTDPRFVAA